MRFGGLQTLTMPNVNGTFTADIQPEPPFDDSQGVILQRLNVTKVFEGPMQGTSSTQMLSVRTPHPNCASYVALEHFQVQLEGRTGTFVATHHGLSNPAGKTLDVIIASNSGTGELQGIEGTFTIQASEGVHHYSLNYTLSKPPLP